MQHQANNKYEQELLDNSALYHQMVYVPGGTFIMGSDGANYPDARPVRKVNLDSFFMGKYQVTQALYEKIIGKNPSAYKDDTSCPVSGVSWEDATLFCNELNRLCGYNSKAGYRLPTEAEWEFAAKGGEAQDDYPYSGSESVFDVAWHKGNTSFENQHGKTHPVGLLLPNHLGLFDMSGNIYEWCSDWYAQSYDVSDTHNPKGPSDGSEKVLRGGNCANIKEYCQVENRSNDYPYERIQFFGFRLAFTL